MCASSFPSIGLPRLLLFITASYRCHPQASPCCTGRCCHGPASETWRVGSLGAPSLSCSQTEPTVPCQQWRGPPKTSRTRYRAGTPIFGCLSSPPGHRGEACLSSGWVRRRSKAPAPSSLLLSLLCLKPFCFLRKADSKLKDVYLQLQVYYNGLLNQFMPL